MSGPVIALQATVWLFLGAGTGVVAAAFSPAPDGLDLRQALGWGIAGAIAGGLLAALLVGRTPGLYVGGWLGAIAGAAGLLIVRRIRHHKRATAKAARRTQRSSGDPRPGRFPGPG